MAAVGFELYTRLLAEAVDVLRGRAAGPEPAPVRLDLPGSAYLPDAYVADSGAKLEAYRRFAAIRSDGDAEALRADLRDRFGPIPRRSRASSAPCGAHGRRGGRRARSARRGSRLVTMKWPRFDRQSVSRGAERGRLPPGAGLEPGAAAGRRRPRPGRRGPPRPDGAGGATGRTLELPACYCAMDHGET